MICREYCIYENISSWSLCKNLVLNGFDKIIPQKQLVMFNIFAWTTLAMFDFTDGRAWLCCAGQDEAQAGQGCAVTALGTCPVPWGWRAEPFGLRKPSELSNPAINTCPQGSRTPPEGCWQWGGVAECSSCAQRALSRTRQIFGTAPLPLLDRAGRLCSNAGLLLDSKSSRCSSKFIKVWRICLKFILRGQKNVPRLELAAHQAWRGAWWFINLSLSKRHAFLSNICFQEMSNNKDKLERKKNEENAGWEKNWGLNMIPRFPVC